MSDSYKRKDGVFIASHHREVINKKLLLYVAFLHRPTEALRSLFKTL
jgi:hypothetical protein